MAGQEDERLKPGATQATWHGRAGGCGGKLFRPAWPGAGGDEGKLSRPTWHGRAGGRGQACPGPPGMAGQEDESKLVPAHLAWPGRRMRASLSQPTLHGRAGGCEQACPGPPGMAGQEDENKLVPAHLAWPGRRMRGSLSRPTWHGQAGGCGQACPSHTPGRRMKQACPGPPDMAGQEDESKLVPAHLAWPGRRMRASLSRPT
ncbi:hypothetical protein CYMTET_4489 [Cymbomonas tetramitiformis]|uniref:Uncharacterized protein n=1 Tax=Cymbomonas tetramitiformis TaxID=36881 RepID=A0AAE0LKG3_9CHLO|nr:hypothetical protein CYMTET_4489 [Cymbomonas tetramitiformis]